MKYQKVVKKIVAVGLIAVLGAGLIGCTTGKELKATQEQLASAQADANDLNAQVAEVNAKLASAEGSSSSLEAEKAQLESQLEQYKLELDAKDKQLLEDATSAVEPADLEVSYEFDDLELGQEFEATLTDTKLSYLFDGDVEWDDEDYTAFESLKVKGIVTANDADFAGKPHLKVSEEWVEYKFELDNDLNTSLIDEDETLKFSFLGEAVEVTSWDGDSVTFLKGNEHFMKEAEAVDVNGKAVELFVVGEDYAYVKVDGQGKKVNEGETEVVNGLEVYVSEVVETTSWRAGGATVRLGNKVSETVDNGDEWVEDSAWEWTVTPNSLGLNLVENFVDVDEDEMFKALAVGEMLSLPSSFTEIKFDGFESVKYDDVKVSTTTKNGNPYLKLKGSFEQDYEEYDLLYVNASGFYDEDLELVSATTMGLEDKELEFTLDGDYLVLDDVNLKLDFSELTVDAEDLSAQEDDWLNAYGILIKGPENALEDESLTLEVPDEQATLSVSVGKK